MASSSCTRPHAVLVPFPAQGHVNPMMRFAQKLLHHGFTISFVNTDYNHARILQANGSSHKSVSENDFSDIRWVVVPDGLPHGDSRTDIAKMCHVTETVIVSFVDKLIGDLKEQDPEQDICLVTDTMASTALDAAKRHRIPMAALFTSMTAVYALLYNLPNLVATSAIPANGVPEVFQMVKYLPSMETLCSAHLPWVPGFTAAQQEFLFHFTERYMERVRELKWVLFNSFYYLEAPVIDSLVSQGASICTIGPFVQNGNGQSETEPVGFWAEEPECLEWLDKQSPKSVIYVAFGSLAILNQRQLEEFALGLEATQRPFLWVLRSDLMDGTSVVLPPAFVEATRERACFVSWSPQLQVLSNPSVACFFTHCGWNSVVESISVGVPMLCWPYFADQFLNCVYVVEAWKIGLLLNAKKDGVIERKEVERAVERLLEDNEMKTRVTKLSQKAKDAFNDESGSSNANFTGFINAMKEKICVRSDS
ncbi:hypothetical protein KI387_041114 [Taxus chinensis]|uniref:Glycosyltransferase n=1 Tax=Taxus chinensis TaxID=29808 RepID=A0AA38CAE9_TAXCH|nr:hypothetical protein KI387_041114 [Taxus chinensis]